MNDENLKKLVASNARAIEALTANVSELARDRQEMYRLMADVASAQSTLASAQAGLASAQADFYRRLAQTDKRQGEIIEILKLLTKKVDQQNSNDSPN
jgi:uncharacterized protein (UPF0264 family)